MARKSRRPTRAHKTVKKQASRTIRRTAARTAARPAPKPARRLTRASELGQPGYVAGGRHPAADLQGVAPVRLTAYLRPDQVVRLRSEAADRQAQGERADMSSLLRAAVDLLLPALRAPKPRSRLQRGARSR